MTARAWSENHPEPCARDVLEQVSPAEWDALLPSFADATVYQTRAYGDVRFGASALEHVVIRDGDVVVAGAQVQILRVRALNAGIARTVWGPLWRTGDGEPDCRALLRMTEALRAEYAERRGLVIRVAPPVVADHEGAELVDGLLARGWRRRGAAYRTILFELDDSLDVLRTRPREGWRRNLRRAASAGLEIEEGTDDRLFLEFLGLYEEMIDRKKFVPGVDAHEFRDIQQQLPEAKRARIFVARAEGEAVAAIICSCVGDSGVYLLGATGDKGLELRGSYLLHWRAVEWLVGIGARRYDLGGCHPTENPGTYQFKAGTGGFDVEHVGEFEVSGSIASSLALRAGEGLRGWTQSLRNVVHRVRLRRRGPAVPS